MNGDDFHGGTLDVPITKSSQFISALLLIAPFVDGGITLRCETPVTSSTYIDLTIATLHTFGVEVSDSTEGDKRIIAVPQKRVTHRDIEVEPDASSAVYFAAVAAIHKGLTVTLEGLSLNSSQPDIEAIRLLGTIGAEVVDTENGIKVTGTGNSTRFLKMWMLQVSPMHHSALQQLQRFADSPSRIYGLETLPLKESDRIEVMARSLAKNWFAVFASSDSDIRISPMLSTAPNMKVAVDPVDDHRIAMAMAVVGTKRHGVSIVNPNCVSKSYPNFWNDLRVVYEGKEVT